MQNNVSLCSIVKNSMDVLPTFLNWAVDNFSEINIVCDTDNDDDTEKYLNMVANGGFSSREHHAIVYKVNVIFHKFDNFSNQWNRAIEMSTKKYCLYMGCDEILEDIPNDGIEKVMNRSGADVGIFPRYNFQGDDEHCIGYPDHQYRVIRMSSGIKMNGKVVDETLGFTERTKCIIIPWNILHYGHIRPIDALKLKGKDRIKFANDDACDGEMLKKYGENWFIERNKLWNDKRTQVPICITNYSRKYWRHNG